MLHYCFCAFASLIPILSQSDFGRKYSRTCQRIRATQLKLGSGSRGGGGRVIGPCQSPRSRGNLFKSSKEFIIFRKCVYGNERIFSTLKRKGKCSSQLVDSMSKANSCDPVVSSSWGQKSAERLLPHLTHRKFASAQRVSFDSGLLRSAC